DSGPRPWPAHGQREARPRRELLVGTEEGRHRGGKADAVQRAKVEEPAEEEPKLVPGSLRLGRKPPVPRQDAALEQAECCLGVSDVDREQSGHANARLSD